MMGPNTVKHVWATLLSKASPYLTLINVFGVLAILLLACYTLAPQFGLYVDDYNTVSTWGESWKQIQRNVLRGLTEWQRGRPLPLLHNAVFAQVSWLLGGLSGVYILSYGVLACNSLLTFAIVKRFAPPVIAMAAALMMIVYPGDAAKMIAVRGAQVQLVITFFLAATLLYLKGHRILPYLMMAWSIGLYETTVVPFFFVPLLAIPWQKTLPRQLITHMIIFGLIFGAMLIARSFFSSRFLPAAVDGGSGPISLLIKAASAPFIGLITNLKLLVLRPFSAMAELDVLTVSVILLVGLAVFFLLSLNLYGQSAEIGQRPARTQTANSSLLDTILSIQIPSQILISGLVLTLAAYVLMISDERFPPTMEIGIRTSTHSAAEVGVSLMFAAVFWMGLQKVRSQNVTAFLIAISIYLALLGGFQAKVQKGLADGWNKQVLLWAEILRLAPDIENGTLIVVDLKDAWRDPHMLSYQADDPSDASRDTIAADKIWINNPYIESYSFLLQFGLRKIFRFPKKWEIPKALWLWQVDGSTPMFAAEFVETETGPEAQLPFERKPRKLIQGNVIWLEVDGKKLKRVYGTKTLQGVNIQLKPKGPSTREQLKPGPLYDLLGSEQAHRASTSSSENLR